MKGKVWVWEAPEGTHSGDRDLSTACITGTHIRTSSRSQPIYLQFHRTDGSRDKEQWANPDDSQRWDTIDTQVTVSFKRIQKGIPETCMVASLRIAQKRWGGLGSWLPLSSSTSQRIWQLDTGIAEPNGWLDTWTPAPALVPPTAEQTPNTTCFWCLSLWDYEQNLFCLSFYFK